MTLANGKEIRRYQCTECGKFLQSNPFFKRQSKILLLDIETLPGEYYAFDAKVDYLTPDKRIKDWSISCWAAKWLFEPEIMGDVVTVEDAINRRSEAVLEPIWRLIDQAHVVVTHNGIRFDMRKLNTKFILAGYNPPLPYFNVDTFKVAKETFGFTYNRLDELAKELGIGQKNEMRFYDWKKCIENGGSQEYLDKMLTYCKNDIAPLLEDVYLTFLPWIPNHPNLGIFSDNDGNVCRNCESTDLHWGHKYATAQGLWRGWRCNSCGAVGRGSGKPNKIRSVIVR